MLKILNNGRGETHYYVVSPLKVHILDYSVEVDESEASTIAASLSLRLAVDITTLKDEVQLLKADNFFM